MDKANVSIGTKHDPVTKRSTIVFTAGPVTLDLAPDQAHGLGGAMLNASVRAHDENCLRQVLEKYLPDAFENDKPGLDACIVEMMTEWRKLVSIPETPAPDATTPSSKIVIPRNRTQY